MQPFKIHKIKTITLIAILVMIAPSQVCWQTFYSRDERLEPLPAFHIFRGSGHHLGTLPLKNPEHHVKITGLIEHTVAFKYG